MIILEAVCYGLRSLRKVTKLTFRPGLNVIYGRTGAGKSTLFECLQVVLLGLEAAGLRTNGIGETTASQAAVTLKLRDGAIYRVARDFVKNAFHILRWDASTKAFVSLSTDVGILQQLWQPEAGGLPFEDLRTFIAWSPGSCSTPVRDDANGAVPDLTQSVVPGLTTEERAVKLQRLNELTAALVRAEALAQSADERAAAHAREAELRRRLERVDTIREHKVSVDAKQDEMAPFLNAPKDFDRLIEEYLKALPALHEERAALEEEAAEIGVKIDALAAQPFLKTPLFWSGVVVTGVSFLVALFLTLTGWTQHLPIVGLAVGMALLITALALDFRRLGAKQQLEARRTNLTLKASRLEDRLKRTYAAPLAVIAHTGCSDPESFKVKRHAAFQWATERDALAREEAGILAGTSRESIEADWQAAKRQAEELDRQAGPDVDVESLRDAIGLLTRELDTPSHPSVAPPRNIALDSDPNQADPLRAHAKEIDVCLQRLSEERLGHIASSNGDLVVQRRGAPDPVSIQMLSGGETVLARLSIVIGAWVARRAVLGFPLLLDDPLAVLDPQTRRVLVDTLTKLGTQGQILLFTNSPLPDNAGVFQTALTPT